MSQVLNDESNFDQEAYNPSFDAPQTPAIRQWLAAVGLEYRLPNGVCVVNQDFSYARPCFSQWDEYSEAQER